MRYNDLMNEVAATLSTRFTPQVADIKEVQCYELTEYCVAVDHYAGDRSSH